MTMQMIPGEKWVEFFDDFSRKHQGKLATLEVVRAPAQTELIAQNLPLVGISADRKDGENIVTITLGDDQQNYVTRMIDDALRVAVNQVRAELSPSLRIDSMSEATTLLTLR